MKKKILSLLLCLVMVLSLMPTAAFADVVASGTCGAEGDGHNLTWTLDSEGVLTISGEGTMKDYSNAIDDYEGIITTAPWGGHIKQLKSVVINSGVTSIGDNAFYGCNGLTSVTIPNSVTSIGSSVFYGCSNLTDVYYNSTDIAWQCISIDYGNDALDNANMHYAEPTGRIVASGTCGADGDNLTWVLDDEGTLTISGIGAMEDYNWDSSWHTYDSAIKSVTINNGVTSIGIYGFEYCNNLKSITIGESVASIGYGAFSECSNLTKINFNAKSVEDTTSLPSAFENAGMSGTGIETIFGEKVERIPSCLFYGCSSLTSVTIPNSVTSIGGSAFYGCQNLKDVYYNSTDIAWQCISIDYGNDALDNANMHYAEPTGRIVASGTCGAEGDGSNLTWTLDDKGALAIGGTGPMEDYYWDSPWHTYGSAIKSVIINNGLTSVGSHAFSGCISVTSVTIPDSVTSIGGYAFWDCSNLTSVTIGKNVTSVGGRAFYNCEKLNNMDIRDLASWCEIDFEYRDDNPLWHTHKLSINGVPTNSLVIPDGVTHIGDYSFLCCDNLTSVTIPDSVTYIGDCAFFECGNLTELNFNAKNATVGSDVFSNAGASENGMTVAFGETVESIPDYLFLISSWSGDVIPNPKIVSVIIPDSVTSIGKAAFCGCSGLSSVIIPDSVTSIGEDAFCGCKDLESVTIGTGVIHIGARAFQDCTKLTEVHYNAKAAEDLTHDYYYCPRIFDNAGIDGNGIKLVIGKNVKKIPNYFLCTYFSWYGAENPPKISQIVYEGNAPVIGNDAFRNITTKSYYPYGNNTWTSAVMTNYGGKITWMPYSTAEVVSVECTIQKDIYVVGDTLDTSGITVTINRADGCVETYDYDDGEIELGAYDMSKPGSQSIAVTCKDATTKLNIYVHDKQVKTMDAKDYPESSHNYENNLDKTYTYKVPNGLSMEVTFSEKTAVETNVDYIYVNGTQYTGTALAGKTISIDGDTLIIRLVSDGSDTEYGFSIDSIVATTFVLLGDVNGDDEVTDADAVYLLYYTFFGDESYHVNQPCDFNGDGEVTDADAVYLLYYTFFGEESYPLH